MVTDTGWYKCLKAGRYLIEGEIYRGYVSGGTLVIKDCSGNYGPYPKGDFEFVKAQKDIFK